MYNNWDMIIDNLDEELINHAAETMAKKGKSSFKPNKLTSIAGTAAAIAACLCIAVGGIIIANGGFGSALTGGSTVTVSGEQKPSETTENTQYTTISVEAIGGYTTEEILLIYVEQSNTVEELYQKIYNAYDVDLIPSVSVYKDEADYKNGIEILEGDLENGMVVSIVYDYGESQVEIIVQGKESISDFEYVFDKNYAGMIITKYVGNAQAVNIPAEIDGKPVTVIENYAFTETSVSSVIIPDGVVKIAGYAFYECASLTSVTIPDSVTEIGAWAFKGTSWLEAQPQPVIINNILLDYSSASGDVVISDEVTKISDYAFHECASLTSITIPDSVDEIGDTAFEGCENITVTYKGVDYTYVKMDDLYAVNG